MELETLSVVTTLGKRTKVAGMIVDSAGVYKSMLEIGECSFFTREPKRLRDISELAARLATELELAQAEPAPGLAKTG